MIGDAGALSCESSVRRWWRSRPCGDESARPAVGQAQTGGGAAQAAAPARRRAVYAAMPENERMAIQSDLIWTGDYNGIVDADFGDNSVAAVKAFQKRNGGKETGILNPDERAEARRIRQHRSRSVPAGASSTTARPARASACPASWCRNPSPSASGRRWQSVARRGAGRDFPDHGRGHDADIRHRAHEEGNGQPQGRLPARQAGLLRHLRNAGRREEILRARPDQGRRGARRDHPLRHGDGEPGRPVVIAISNAFVGFPAQGAGASGR